MKNINALIKELRPLMDNCTVHTNFVTGPTYSYKKVGGNIIEVCLKNTYYDGRAKMNKQYSDKVLLRTFNNLTKELNAEITIVPTVKDLGYDDSLVWLYHHYPYGETSNSNCILVNSEGNIIAINYNGLDNTAVIYTLGTIEDRGGVVINNKYFYKGVVNKQDLDLFIEGVKILIDNNNTDV